MPVRTVDAPTLKRWLDAGEAELVDVRPAGMYAAERIAGARSAPLDQLDAAALPAGPGRRLVFQCEIGILSHTAAERAAAAGREAWHLAGGIQAWKQAGYDVAADAGAPIPVLRQMQMVAGTLILAGTVLAAAVSPWWLLLTGFVGAGIFIAGATGWCGMTMVLLRLPFNRPRARARA